VLVGTGVAYLVMTNLIRSNQASLLIYFFININHYLLPLSHA